MENLKQSKDSVLVKCKRINFIQLFDFVNNSSYSFIGIIFMFYVSFNTIYIISDEPVLNRGSC